MMTDPYEDIPPVPVSEMPGCFMIDPEDDAEKEAPPAEPAAGIREVMEAKPTVTAGPAREPVQEAEADDDPPFDVDEPPVPEMAEAPVPVLPDDEPAPEPVQVRPQIPEQSPEPVAVDESDNGDIDDLDEELFSFDEKPKPKLLTVVVRVDPNAQPGSSGRRIRRLHGLVSSYPGRDRFSFMIVEAGKIYLVDYPDVHTNVCNELISKLTAQVGAENVQVEEKAPMR